MLKQNDGFTLIELLIVVVIIGLLAGVLISIIDPTGAQNRAKDATVMSTINKLALSAEGFVSAYGTAPSATEFEGGVKDGSITAQACDDATDTDTCMFSITGNSLPDDCGVNGWSGHVDTGGAQCYYMYERTGSTSGQFTIVGKAFGREGKVFKYDNSVGAMEVCDATSINTCTQLNQ